MATFNPQIPQPGDLISDSQSDLLNNSQVLDTVFNIDHYTYSDGTVNQGKHQEVTTPLDPTTPIPTTVNDPKLFGWMPTGSNLPVIQFSKAPNDAVPSPVTLLQSPAAGQVIGAGGFLNIFDFTGMTRAMGMVTAMDKPTLAFLSGVFFFESASGVATTVLFPPTGLSVSATGAIFRLQNTTGVAFPNVFWSIQFWRIE